VYYATTGLSLLGQQINPGQQDAADDSDGGAAGSVAEPEPLAQESRAAGSAMLREA
jgi:hypothetical protein